MRIVMRVFPFGIGNTEPRFAFEKSYSSSICHRTPKTGH